VGTGVIEEQVHVVYCFDSCFALCRSEGSETNEHGAVDSAGRVQEGSNNLLKAFDLLGRQSGRCVWRQRELYLCSILQWVVKLWGMLGFGWSEKLKA
jgi:hypothetical protein